METKGFSVGEFVKKGWHMMREHMAFFIGFLLVYFVLSIIPRVITLIYPHIHVGILAVIQIVFFILAFVVWIGFLKSALKVVDGKSLTYADLFSSFPIIVQFFIAWVIYGLIVLVGFILLVFPAAIWGSRYFLWPFIIVDKGVGPIKALEMSGKMTMGVKWDIFMLLIATTIITLLGVLCLFVGWFVAMPAATIAQVATYRMLESQHQNV